MQQPVPHEQDASTITSSHPSTALPELCALIHTKLQRFLDEPPRNERIREVQKQTVTSLGVIGEALSKYRLARTISNTCMSYVPDESTQIRSN